MGGDNIILKDSVITAKERLVCKQDSSNLAKDREERARKYCVRRPSAGVRALYDPNVLTSEEVQLRGNSYSTFSFEKRVKCRFVWVCWKQFSNDYNSYKEYTNYLDGKISIRK